MNKSHSNFHLHLISDSTGETLIATSRAVTSQYKTRHAIEHVYPSVRNQNMLEQALAEIKSNPGIVLYTITDTEIGSNLATQCRQLGVPCVSVLEPIFLTFQSYLGAPTERKVGAQHALDAEYFARIEALNFSMMHDDGALPENINEPDVILLGISRTSKTPTSIYLANRGIKTANVPLVPDVELPPQIITADKPLIVALVASTDRIYQVRHNRLLGLNANTDDTAYTDRASIAEELANTRKLCAKHKWPTIDVSRKSIEETAAAILALREERDTVLGVSK
ncbi:MAG: kinase/pyrophosphorylase [Rhizobiaceae bacterium]|nr:kinase/pyrophosphorylase [Rhizobiaceae bacterium]